MKILWESPLIFDGNPDIEPLSVRLRVALHDAFCEIDKLGDQIEHIAKYYEPLRGQSFSLFSIFSLKI